jgi:hypothetical protein
MPAIPNPQREKMEELIKHGMSRDEAYKEVFGVDPRNVQGLTPTNFPAQARHVSHQHVEKLNAAKLGDEVKDEVKDGE